MNAPHRISPLRFSVPPVPLWQVLVLVLTFAALSACTNQAATPQAQQQDELDRKFIAMMNGVTMVGRSTSLSNDRVSGEEQYIIEKVSKLQGDTWLFQARFKYGQHDIPIPMPVQIKWAGDTPVICVTDFAVPNMGTYSARIVLHNGQYAGTWNGKDHGGQMFGKLVPIKK